MGLSPIRLRTAAALVASALLAGCGSLPPQVDQPVSHALAPSSDGPLARTARDSTATPSLSGFRLMPQAYYSLDVRIQLVRRARERGVGRAIPQPKKTKPRLATTRAKSSV